MSLSLTSFEPLEIVVLLVALAGLVPVLTQYREQTKLFAVGYVLLVLSAIATNLEGVVLADLLNFVEHSAGIMGAGIAFCVAAYVRRQDVVAAGGQ